MRSVQTFQEFLTDAAKKGDVVNTLFEERLFNLVGVLHKITDTLSIEGISYELIGGLAVLVHVEEANPEYTTLTRDVDLMVCRSDLERIKEIDAKNGFRFRLVFSGERVRPEQAMPNPPIAPEKKRIHGKEIMIIPVPDLLRMKLSSYRDKDRVHVRSMDAAGLITPETEGKLSNDLLARLQHVRRTE